MGQTMRIVLHQPEIAANFGNIMRSCACFGVPLEIIEPTGFPLSAKDVRRAAMDYGTSVELTRHASWSQFQDQLYQDGDPRAVLFTTKGAETLKDFSFRSDDRLVFGAESSGVPTSVHESCDARVVIPIRSDARSLNLSNAVAIALFEALRQNNLL